jgi:hypothetical protein
VSTPEVWFDTAQATSVTALDATTLLVITPPDGPPSGPDPGVPDGGRHGHR